MASEPQPLLKTRLAVSHSISHDDMPGQKSIRNMFIALEKLKDTLLLQAASTSIQGYHK
jgi:hypothetical protein